MRVSGPGPAGAAAAAFLKSKTGFETNMGAFALLPPPPRLGKATWEVMSTLAGAAAAAEPRGAADGIDRHELLRGGSLGRVIPDAGVLIAVLILC